MDINETNEDTPSMTTSTVATTDGGLSKKGSHKEFNQGDTWKIFDVDTGCFEKFRSGRKKFERWARFLNMDDETHKSIYDYASKHSKNTIVLRCSQTGALRAIRRRSSNDL